MLFVILADDLGYNGITLHGGGIVEGAVPTPNIDGIAKEGVEFVYGYAGDSTCAPSRAAIMSGRYATRFGFEFTPVPAIHARLVTRMGLGEAADKLHPVILNRDALENVPAMDDEAIPTTEITIADVLRRQGYHTIHLGKWHLGGRAGSRSEDKGFDESLGFIPGPSMYLKESDPDVENARVAIDPMEKLLWAGASLAVHITARRSSSPQNT
jgi:arylsulfatase A-like enzyme